MERVLAATTHLPAAARFEALIGASALAAQQGDYGVATVASEELLAQAEALDDKPWIVRSLGTLAEIAVDQGDVARATRCFEEALALARAIGATDRTALMLVSFGRMLAFSQGDHGRATQLFEESLALWRQLDDSGGITYTTLHLGLMTMMMGTTDQLPAGYGEALRKVWVAGNRVMVGYGLVALAHRAAQRGQIEQAARLWGAAEALHETIGARLAPAARLIDERRMTAARTRLGEAAFAAAWQAGRAMSLQQAIAEALGEDAGSGEPQETGQAAKQT